MSDTISRNGHLPTALEIALSGNAGNAGREPRRGGLPTPSELPRQLPKAPEFGEVGFTGLLRFRGLIAEEYVPDLQGTRLIDTYTRMRSDATIEALLTALRLPIIAGSWNFAAGGQDANAKRALEIAQDQLFNRLGYSWEDEIRKSLTYLQYGFGVSAKNWGTENGEAVLRELRPLHPRTLVSRLNNWEFDPQTGQLLGCWQWGTDGNRWREEFIPEAAMLHLAHDADFGNPQGRGVFRSAYKHWLILDTLYRIQAIGLERGAIGTPVVKYEPGTPEQKQKDAQEAASALYSHESAAIAIPNTIALENFSVHTSTADLMAAIHHHSTKITQVVLAEFLNLGQEGAGGAYALSADKTDFFLLTLQAIANYVASRLNRDVIPEIVHYNVATDQYPKISCQIARETAAAVADYIQKLTSGLNPPVTPDEALEDHIRAFFNLPARAEPRPPRLIPTTAAPEGSEEVGGAPGIRAPDGPAGPGEGEKPPPPAPPEKSMGRRDRPRAAKPRERIHIHADPPRFKEEPTYPAQGALIAELLGELRRLLAECRGRVFKAANLEEPQARRPFSWLTRWRGGYSPRFAKVRVSDADLDSAIETFLQEVAGEDRSRNGFAGTDTDDAALQGYERLAHAAGQQRALELLGEDAAKFRPDRSSPEVRALLEKAFDRLSDGGRLRLEGKLDEIRSVLADAQEQGTDPFAVADDLAARFDGLEGYDFERLARTEMAFASNAGIRDEMQAQGVKRLQFLVSPLACEVCQAYDGQDVEVESDDLPPFHVNCLCSLTAADSEGEEGGGEFRRPFRFGDDEGGHWITTDNGPVFISDGDPREGGERAPSPTPSQKSVIAKQSANPTGGDVQRYAEEHCEHELAKDLSTGGAHAYSLRDNEPVDVIRTEAGQVKDGVELKVMADNKSGKITMNAAAMERKGAWMKENGAEFHTVVFDDRHVFNANGPGKHGDTKNREIYYRRGYGSFRVTAMHRCADVKELNRMIGMPKADLPKAAAPLPNYRGTR